MTASRRLFGIDWGLSTDVLSVEGHPSLFTGSCHGGCMLTAVAAEWRLALGAGWQCGVWNLNKKNDGRSRGEAIPSYHAMFIIRSSATRHAARGSVCAARMRAQIRCSACNVSQKRCASHSSTVTHNLPITTGATLSCLHSDEAAQGARSGVHARGVRARPSCWALRARAARIA